MKKFLLATVAIAVLGAALPVCAADLPVLPVRPPIYSAPPAYVAPIYCWTGFYIGGHLGAVFSSTTNFSGGLATGNGRFLGGVQAGYDWQFNPNWVVGVEGQYSLLSGSVGAAFPGGFVYTNSQRGLGSVTARIGYSWGPGMVYVKGGFAFADNNEKVTLGGAPITFATTGDHASGYTIGAG